MSYYDYYYGYNSYTSPYEFLRIGGIVCAILAIIGAIVLTITFLAKKNSNKFRGFLGWIYDTLNFNKFLLEIILKVTYLILAVFVTLYSFILLFSRFYGFLPFIYLLIGGNIGLRILYEFSMILLTLCRHASEINKKLGPLNEEIEPKPERIPRAGRVNPPQDGYQQGAYQQGAYQQQPPQQPPPPPPEAQQPPVYRQQASYQQPEFRQEPPVPPQPPIYQWQDSQPQQQQPQQQAAPQPQYQQPGVDLSPSFCAHCGSIIDAGVVNCPNCGKPRL